MPAALTAGFFIITIALSGVSQWANLNKAHGIHVIARAVIVRPKQSPFNRTMLIDEIHPFSRGLLRPIGFATTFVEML
jgi:hypothetical protein